MPVTTNRVHPAPTRGVSIVSFSLCELGFIVVMFIYGYYGKVRTTYIVKVLWPLTVYYGILPNRAGGNNPVLDRCATP